MNGLHSHRVAGFEQYIELSLDDSYRIGARIVVQNDTATVRVTAQPIRLWHDHRSRISSSKIELQNRGHDRPYALTDIIINFTA
jgi:hypothetical protein